MNAEERKRRATLAGVALDAEFIAIKAEKRAK